MASLKDIISLCTEQDGKVFVVDGEGEIQFVLLSKQRFLELKNGVKQESKGLDPEVVNRQILKAQLESENEEISDLKTSLVNRFKTLVQAKNESEIRPPVQSQPKVDLREEVIDPSFDFDS